MKLTRDKFLPSISIDELKALRKAERDTKARDRLPVYMARKRGDSIRKIADDFGSTYSTIRDWLLRAKGGLDRLHDTRRLSPPRRLDAAHLAGIREDLLAEPRKLGFGTDMWTGKILAEHIRRKYGITFVPRTMQTLMHEMGFRHLKPRPRHLFVSLDLFGGVGPSSELRPPARNFSFHTYTVRGTRLCSRHISAMLDCGLNVWSTIRIFSSALHRDFLSVMPPLASHR